MCLSLMRLWTFATEWFHHPARRRSGLYTAGVTYICGNLDHSISMYWSGLSRLGWAQCWSLNICCSQNQNTLRAERYTPTDLVLPCHRCLLIMLWKTSTSDYRLVYSPTIIDILYIKCDDRIAVADSYVSFMILREFDHFVSEKKFVNFVLTKTELNC